MFNYSHHKWKTWKDILVDFACFFTNKNWDNEADFLMSTRGRGTLIRRNTELLAPNKIKNKKIKKWKIKKWKFPTLLFFGLGTTVRSFANPSANRLTLLLSRSLRRTLFSFLTTWHLVFRPLLSVEEGWAGSSENVKCLFLLPLLR